MSRASTPAAVFDEKMTHLLLAEGSSSTAPTHVEGQLAALKVETCRGIPPCVPKKLEKSTLAVGNPVHNVGLTTADSHGK